ncbi:MAG: DUF4384 domain-containing protein [Muribaculaceae bacterium]|nr:DUF4384 domain-containing protein [Muribaculaceae bacterium]
MYQLIKYLVCVLAVTTRLAVSAADVKTVTGESTFYGDDSHSISDCKRYALEQARIAALAKEFGTMVSQDVYQRDMLTGQTESTYFTMLNRTEVNGEWLGDEGEPQYTISHGPDNCPVVTCKVRGKARRLTNEAPEFVASVLRNGNEPRFADTRFRQGDDLKLYFRAPVSGYLAVYLVDDSRNVYSLLPYSTQPEGIVKTLRDRDYVFFDTAKADKDFGEPEELVITVDGDVERNQLYVLFSPNPFNRAVDSSTSSNLPRMLGYDAFVKWLSDVRKRDPKMGMKVMHLELTR